VDEIMDRIFYVSSTSSRMDRIKVVVARFGVDGLGRSFLMCGSRGDHFAGEDCAISIFIARVFRHVGSLFLSRIDCVLETPLPLFRSVVVENRK